MIVSKEKILEDSDSPFKLTLHDVAFLPYKIITNMKWLWQKVKSKQKKMRKTISVTSNQQKALKYLTRNQGNLSIVLCHNRIATSFDVFMRHIYIIQNMFIKWE